MERYELIQEIVLNPIFLAELTKVIDFMSDNKGES